MKQKEFITWIY